jgi:hypothetical protein
MLLTLLDLGSGGSSVACWESGSHLWTQNVLVKIFILKVGQKLIFIANFEKLAHFTLVVIKDAIELRHILVTTLTEPVFDVRLILMLTNDIFK